MAIFKEKTLEQQVNEFKSTVEVRESKITGKINALNREAEQLLSQITSDTTKMVELELADDNMSADKLRKTTRAARTRLDEINGEIEGYHGQLKGNNSLFKNDLEKIKVVAQKEKKERSNQREKWYEEITALKSQKDAIDAKIDTLKNEIRTYTDYQLEGNVGVALYAGDERFKQINYIEREKFTKEYLEGKDLEYLFNLYGPSKEKSTPKPSKGVTITYGEGHINSLADVKGDFTANIPGSLM
jgi:cell division septum initiation protein DivIVA